MTTNLPTVHVRPTREEVEFAVAYTENGYNASKTGYELWPTLGHPAQKGSLWSRREGVKVALRAVEERTKHQGRVLMEGYGAGEERRMEVVAGIINGFDKATNRDRLQSIEYADKREGRIQERDNVRINVFTGVATGVGVSGPGRIDPGFSRVLVEVPTGPDETPWTPAFSPLADAGASGAGEGS